MGGSAGDNAPEEADEAGATARGTAGAGMGVAAQLLEENGIGVFGGSEVGMLMEEDG